MSLHDIFRISGSENEEEEEEDVEVHEDYQELVIEGYHESDIEKEEEEEKEDEEEVNEDYLETVIEGAFKKEKKQYQHAIQHSHI